MELSYAQRLEDYHLALAFAGQADGFYVDVGAGHPVADNVTYWFYLQGWRGLVVEPQEGLLALYPHLRPRDLASGSLVGRAEGEATLFAFERLHGFSTTVPEHAASAGEPFAELRRPVTTLAALCAAHGIGRVDILKIDVEGAEADVLAGLDWSRQRPRVIVVEAVAPGSMADTSASFQPLLLANGYEFVLFDGLNRFYVAREEAALLARFPREPAPWGAARHLYEFGRAPDEQRHPDHALARRLVAGFLARLPLLPPDRLAEYLGEVPPETDAFRAALGRIAAPYDGGLMLDEPEPD